jgi:pimeloyl-ACP methyl ester carboxylesterase
MNRMSTYRAGVIALAALAYIPASLAGQGVAGDWKGALEVQGTELRLVFHIRKVDSGYVTTLDSPGQGASGIPVATTTFSDPELRLDLPNISASYAGTLDNGSIEGTWTQGPTSYPLVLSRDAAGGKARRRPQEPEPPYPYAAEEVQIRGADADVTLAGTLTIPTGAGEHPAVLLISGSGPQNRNEEVFGHRPFLVLADYLTRRGIVVLRYDDRGVGRSTGIFATATSLDFAKDAAAAVRYLRQRPEVDASRIGLVGHSEGAHLASMVAARFEGVAHLVLLAGIGVPGSEVSLRQAMELRPFDVPDEAAFERFARGSIEIASSTMDSATATAELTRHYESIRPALESMLPDGVEVDTFIGQQVANMLRPWNRFFLRYDPAVDLERVDVPVLSLNGSRDVQVRAGINQRAIAAALRKGGNTQFTIRELPGLNHLFQESETGSMAEYERIEQTFSRAAMGEIATWILEQGK